MHSFSRNELAQYAGWPGSRFRDPRKREAPAFLHESADATSDQPSNGCRRTRIAGPLTPPNDIRAPPLLLCQGTAFSRAVKVAPLGASLLPQAVGVSAKRLEPTRITFVFPTCRLAVSLPTPTKARSARISPRKCRARERSTLQEPPENQDSPVRSPPDRRPRAAFGLYQGTASEPCHPRGERSEPKGCPEQAPSVARRASNGRPISRR